MAFRTFLTFSLLVISTSAWPWDRFLFPALKQKRALPSGFNPKVLCVGDSITVGFGDHPDPNNIPDGTNNGYRLDLYNKFTDAGYSPIFLGSQTSGTNNPQPHHEGYGGQVINTIMANVKSGGALSQGPNLILIHAGTNDMDVNQDNADDSTSWANAPARLGNLIDAVLCSNPQAVVLVAELVHNNYHPDQTDAFNAAVPGVVGQRYEQGFKVRVVDMTMVQGFLLSDSLHPTAGGYSVMADQWWDAIQKIPEDWWSNAGSSAPTVLSATIDTCDRNALSFSPMLNGNNVNDGWHVANDSPDPTAGPVSTGMQWVPNWGSQSTPALGAGYPGSGVQILDIDGDGFPDYVWVNMTAGNEGAVYAWLGNGQPGYWKAANNGNMVAFGLPGTSYTEFADLDGDKKPELIYIANGMFRIYQNNAQNGDLTHWSELPNAEGQLNYIFVNNAPFHWWADFNGDGKADLMVENGNNVLDLYINNGPDGNGGFTYRKCPGVGIATDRPVWADIDGDGKADYIAVDSDGGASGWLNNFDGVCTFHWAPINGRGPKSLAYFTGSTAGAVRFTDMTGDGKADYITVRDSDGLVNMNPNTGQLTPPDNDAIGGWAASLRFADMDGDGLDDYASVTSYSGVGFSQNGGQFGSSWLWTPAASGNVIALGYPGGTRHDVLLADLNGDARYDYVYVDDDTGQLHCYLNQGSNGGSGWNWNIKGLIADGVGGVGKGVRLADFDGDGRPDYIYLDVNGVAKVWRNSGPGDFLAGWIPMDGGDTPKVAAIGVGGYREDVQFADLDGDGKADYIWVHPDTGDVQVWYNLWDGSTYGWLQGGTVLSGLNTLGRSVRFGRMTTSGRNDIIVMDETSGSIRVWQNTCSNVIGHHERPALGKCAPAPLPTQTTMEPAPIHTSFSTSFPTAAQCTTTYSNGGLAVYATGAASTSGCSGASRVVWNGHRVSMKVEQSASAEVNSIPVTALYTSVSNAMMDACPTPNGGSVTSCATPAAVTGIATPGQDGTIIHQGTLSISLPYVRYSTDTTRKALINLIAAVVQAQAGDPGNTKLAKQVSCGIERNVNYCVDLNVTTIPAIIEAIYSVQDLSTNGNIVIENIEAQFSMDSPTGGDYGCTAAGLANDVAGLVGSTDALSGLGLGTAVVGTVLGLTCLIMDIEAQQKDKENDPSPSYGDPIWPSETGQPTPTFTDFPHTYTGPNMGITAFKDPQTPSSSNSYYPTDQPSLVIAVGTTVKLEAVTSARVNVGTLNGQQLNATLFSILDDACPHIPTAAARTVTGCAKAAVITDVPYKTDQVNQNSNNMAWNGNVDIDIPLVQYSSEQARNALLQSVCAAFTWMSNDNNNADPFVTHCGDGGSCLNEPSSGTLYKIGKSAQAIYARQDESTNGTEVIDLLQVRLVFDQPGIDLGLGCSAAGFAASIAGLFALIPGLEFLGFIGPALDVICAEISASGD